MNLILRIKFFTLIFLFITYSISFAEFIKIEEQNCTSTEFNLNATLRNKILSKALVNESLKIMSTKLDEEKIKILNKLFEQSSLNYVLSYKDHEEKSQNSTSLIVELKLDIESIKKTLMNIGVYFNQKVVVTQMETENFEGPDLQSLDNLLKLSGITVDDNVSELKLYIRKVNDSLYTGTLKYKDHYWSGTKNSLIELWETLWGNFFNLPEIKDKFFKTIVLIAGPWYTLTGLKTFDHMLGDKKQILDEVHLISVTFSKGIFGKWEIITIKPDKVTTFLNGYLGARGMEFKIHLLSPQLELNGQIR